MMQLDREAISESQCEVGNLFKWDLRKLSAFKFEHSKGKAQVRCFCITSDFLRSCAAPLCSIRIIQRFSLPVVFVSKEAQKHAERRNSNLRVAQAVLLVWKYSRRA